MTEFESQNPNMTKLLSAPYASTNSSSWCPEQFEDRGYAGEREQGGMTSRSWRRRSMTKA